MINSDAKVANVKNKVKFIQAKKILLLLYHINYLKLNFLNHKCIYKIINI